MSPILPVFVELSHSKSHRFCWLVGGLCKMGGQRFIPTHARARAHARNNHTLSSQIGRIHLSFCNRELILLGVFKTPPEALSHLGRALLLSMATPVNYALSAAAIGDVARVLDDANAAAPVRHANCAAREILAIAFKLKSACRSSMLQLASRFAWVLPDQKRMQSNRARGSTSQTVSNSRLIC